MICKSRKRIGNSGLYPLYISPVKFCITPSSTRIAYKFEGEKDSRLVAVDGFCEDPSVWGPIKSLLIAPSLLLIDMPGFGASEENPTPADMSTYAEAVLTVLDAAHIASCILIGLKWLNYSCFLKPRI